MTDIVIRTGFYMLHDEGMWDRLVEENGGLFPGIYRLHHVDDSGDFVPLPRLLGTDPDGVLYVGTSARVPHRVGSLRKSISAAYRAVDPVSYAHLPYVDPGPHPTGRKIVRIGRAFIDQIPYSELMLTTEKYVPTGEGGPGPDLGYYLQEDNVLRAYEVRFGERPALNG